MHSVIRYNGVVFNERLEPQLPACSLCVQGVIELSRLDGSQRQVLLSGFRQQKPRAIAVDPVNK